MSKVIERWLTSPNWVVRTLVAVPMFKENNLVGAIVIYRQEVRPFTDKQIELVKNTLCKERPDHVRDDVIIAKFWLIGRAYAAAIERRKRGRYSDAGEGHPVGDEFYTEKVAPRVRQSDIDVWFDALRREGNGVTPTSVIIHKKLTDLLYQITNLNKRSLASKYLHFHFEYKFFIYDSRAAYGLSRITGELGLPHPTRQSLFFAVSTATPATTTNKQ